MSNSVRYSPAPLDGAPLWPLSVAGYRALGQMGLMQDDTELLYGLVYRKLLKSPLHTFLVQRLMRLLQANLPANYLIRCEQPITCGDSEPEPDISVVIGSEADFLVDHPHSAELVVEICVTSQEIDRYKLQAYANAGVRECWLVLGPEKVIEVHRVPARGHFSEHSIFRLNDQIRLEAFPGLTLAVSDCFAS